MKYLAILFLSFTLASCDNHNADGTVSNQDSLDSVRQAQEDEMSEEIIESSFDALNR